MTTTDPLALIATARYHADQAHANVERLIQFAYPEHSLRQIAKAAGLSHEQVRRIIKKGTP